MKQSTSNLIIMLLIAAVIILIGALLINNGSQLPTNQNGQENGTDLTGRQPQEPEVPSDVQAHIDSKSNLVRLESPMSLEEVSSPLTVTGEARGYWYFEATFPLVVVDWDGLIIGEGYATAQDEWMTEEFVPFEAEITFDSPELYKDRGAVILQRSNPSGLPQNDDALEVPIRFE